MSNNTEFKTGLKATSLFGGVQIFTIIISIVKSKLVALLLGPEGMGIQGILDSTTQMINGFSSLGLGTSAVKDISEAHATGNSHKVSRTLSVLRRLVWLTGIMGFLACLFLSPVLSKISFDTYDFTISFAAISITLLFMQLNAGQKALLQGTRHFSYMAKATIWGSLLSLFATVPFYYFFKYDGIVPAIISFSLATLLVSWYYSNKVPYEKAKLSLREAIKEGGDMAKMGFFISLQALLSLLSGYIIRVFIGRFGSVSDVGLYVAGFAIVGSYVGLVFSAMATEYYPRLASHNKESFQEFNGAINQQIEISLILISPLICTFIIFGNLAVYILYSGKFEPVTLMLCLAMIGNYFKAPSWCIGFSFLAKGDSKAFMINELLSTLVFSTLQLVFYYYWGMTGIGFAFLLSYIIYLIQVYIVCRFRYKYSFNIRYLRVFFPQMLLGAISLILFLYTDVVIRYIMGCFIILVSSWMSYREMSKYVNIMAVIKQRFNK